MSKIGMKIQVKIRLKVDHSGGAGMPVAGEKYT